ncbi:MAG: ECF transporter S component [Clostridiales bacterium]|nr:ECF transporter S component [Clostridiales bacterium]
MEERTTNAPDGVEQLNKVEQKRTAKQVFSEYFTATRIAYIAIFTALSYALRFLEFALLPGTPISFLKLDFSNVFPLLGGFALGPLAGIIIGVLKELLWIFFSSTFGVGEIANIIMMLPFVLIPTVAYKYHKGIKSVIIFISLGCIAQVLWSFPVNWLFNFPVFVGFNWQFGMSFFLNNYVWGWVMLFNLIKAVSISVIVMLIYKSVSKLIKLTNKKFENRKIKQNTQT